MLNENAHGRQLNVHWRPQSDICRPCFIKYDFIGRFSTLIADADYVLKQITRTPPLPRNGANQTGGKNARSKWHRRGAKSAVQFPRSDPDNQRKKSHHLIRAMLADLRRNDLLRINRLYEYDYRLYGYETQKI